MQDIKAGWVLLRFSFVAKYLYLTARTDFGNLYTGHGESYGSHMKEKKETLRRKCIIFSKSKSHQFSILKIVSGKYSKFVQ